MTYEDFYIHCEENRNKKDSDNNRLIVESGFDLNLSTRLEFSIFISQLDSKPDSGRVESSYSIRSAKNLIFLSSIDLAATKALI